MRARKHRGAGDRDLVLCRRSSLALPEVRWCAPRRAYYLIRQRTAVTHFVDRERGAEREGQRERDRDLST